MEWPPKYDDNYFPPDHQKYWFPKEETMDPDERMELILNKIRFQVAWAYERSGLYKRMWSAMDFEPGDIKTLDDFHKLPVITKEDLRQDLIENPPFGSNICDDW